MPSSDIYIQRIGYCLYSGLLLLILLGISSPLRADISIQVGPTEIPRGEANGHRDITVNNGLFAVAFAVESAPPWGVARGGIVDIAVVRDGVVDYDIASLADFMPNNWSAWPTTYQHVEIIQQTPSNVVIRTRRDWGEVQLETHFHIRSGDRRVHMKTVMFNGGKTDLTEILSGYVVWPDGGYLFGVPGLEGKTASPEAAAFADWSAAYDKNWVLGLHAPFADQLLYSGRDRYQQHSLKAGKRREFEAWLQIENSGNLAPLVKTEIDFQQLPSGTLFGEVRSDNNVLVDEPAVIVLKNGAPYTWALGQSGRYQLKLPAGVYTVFATAKSHAPGDPQTVEISAGSHMELHHSGLKAPGSITFSVNDSKGKALDARISVDKGHKPLIEFMGEKTFFTDLINIGQATLEVAPGPYEFAVSAGGGFTAQPSLVEVAVESGAKHQVNAEVTVNIQPSQQHWFAIDLHHHSDVLDGFTAPEYVLRSELASGMDFSFLSDHDSMANNAEMKRLSEKRSIPFLAGTELSPSWAHFNAYPIAEDSVIDIDIGSATVQDIFAQARRLGAELIHVNHPYGDYGYFKSLETIVSSDSEQTSAVPGGYDSGFDLVEITAGDNSDTLAKIWTLWNSGHDAYLVGGSDVHDVWNEQSGAARTYVHITEKNNLSNLLTALKQGHSYATQGPLIFPEIIFGSEIQHPAGLELSLNYTLAAVSGLKSVTLIERGNVIATANFAESMTSSSRSFKVQPNSDTWYSLIVEDNNGKFAYSNPLKIIIQ
ncbi:MAG: CehA/McbA family metallohydrolase [Oceanicoccus sp.]